MDCVAWSDSEGNIRYVPHKTPFTRKPDEKPIGVIRDCEPTPGIAESALKMQLRQMKPVTSAPRNLPAQVAVWATKFKLPVPQFLDAARWLLNKNCPFCQLGTQVLRRIEELGEEKAQEAIARILEAKKRNDLDELAKIKLELEHETSQ